MFNFEDELIIEHNGVSWLIWIQLLVIFLIFVLYCLSVFAFDLSTSNSDSSSNITAAIASSSTDHLVSDKAQEKNLPKHNFKIVSSRSRNTHVGGEQNIKGEIGTSTSRRITQVGEGTVEGEGSQEAQLDLHPCSYLRLAKSAFLRCLGLDSSSENTASDKRKGKESNKSKES